MMRNAGPAGLMRVFASGSPPSPGRLIGRITPEKPATAAFPGASRPAGTSCANAGGTARSDARDKAERRQTSRPPPQTRDGRQAWRRSGHVRASPGRPNGGPGLGGFGVNWALLGSGRETQVAPVASGVMPSGQQTPQVVAWDALQQAPPPSMTSPPAQGVTHLPLAET